MQVIFKRNAPPEDVPHLEQKIISLPELTPEKITQQQKMIYSSIILPITCTAAHMKITS